jgi:glycosyltransferase involved in cell wall biosynthesis
MISVLMPCYNRKAHVEAALEMYNGYVGKVDFEMCLYDDGSAEGERVSEILARRTFSYPIKFHEIPPKGHWRPPGVALNYMATRMATGDIIVITCPEVRHKDPVLLNVGTYTQTQTFRNDKWWLCAATFREELGRPQGDPDDGRAAPIYYFGAMKRREFFEIGGVDELQKHGGEDGLFVNRLYNCGFKLYWIGEVRHEKHGR